MRLTDSEREDLLRAFYRQRVLPLAEIAAERRIAFFPLAPDSAAETYYIERRDDGNYVHEIDSANLVEELKTLWKDFPELADLAGPVVTLAEAIREEEETEEEISPFIYAMF